MSSLKLKIVTPEGENRDIDCDSVILWMAADRNGRGEGSIGIHKGHTDAVIALGCGPLKALQNGNPVFTTKTNGGFATVLNDTITVVTPNIQSVYS